MNRASLKIIFAAALTCLLLSVGVSAQQQGASKEPIHVVDASTGKPIPEVLILPRYSSFEGLSTMFGEGPGRGTDRDYLARPYVYRSGTRFPQKMPQSHGFMVPPFLFIGKGRTLEAVLVVAPGYRPEWFIDFWAEKGAERKLQLTPVTAEEWVSLLAKTFGPLEGGARRIEDGCGFWDLPDGCKLEIHYGKKERGLVRSFLHRDVRRE